MPHYKRMYDDKEHLFEYDLDGRDLTLTIEKVFVGELTGEKGRKTKKPTIKFVGMEKKLAVNKTNGKTIASMYGTDTDDWVGQSITMYPTTTEFGGETVPCIRVRPVRPDRTSNGKSQGGSRQPNKRGGSANAGQQLIAQYEACTSDVRLAELKAQRGQIWERLDDPTRKAIAEAAHAAKARIDAAAGRDGDAPSSDAGGEDNDDTSDSTPVDEDEAEEIARQEQELGGAG